MDNRLIPRVLVRPASAPIVVASDSIGDACCPAGAPDLIAAPHLALLGAHLDPPLARWLPAITTDAAAAMRPRQRFGDETRLDRLLIHDTDICAALAPGRSRHRPAKEGIA